MPHNKIENISGRFQNGPQIIPLANYCTGVDPINLSFLRGFFFGVKLGHFNIN